jgi:hypothetical protein
MADNVMGVRPGRKDPMKKSKKMDYHKWGWDWNDIQELSDEELESLEELWKDDDQFNHYIQPVKKKKEKKKCRNRKSK